MEFNGKELFMFTCSDIKCSKDSELSKFQNSGNEDMIFTMLSQLAGQQDKHYIKINVLLVCENAGQLKYFKKSIDKVNELHPNTFKKLKFEYWTNKYIRENKKLQRMCQIGYWNQIFILF